MGDGSCGSCSLPFDKGWMVGYRDELVGKMIGEYKYQSVRALALPLAEMMSRIIPETIGGVVIVPLPTIARHVRTRGFDHTLLLARRLGRLRGWRVERLLAREMDSVQVGADEKTRKAQAKKAYRVRGKVRSDRTYLVIDDVWTTGSSMIAGCELLRKAGAKNVLVGVLARNRLREEKSIELRQNRR